MVLIGGPSLLSTIALLSVVQLSVARAIADDGETAPGSDVTAASMTSSLGEWLTSLGLESYASELIGRGVTQLHQLI